MAWRVSGKTLMVICSFFGFGMGQTVPAKKDAVNGKCIKNVLTRRMESGTREACENIHS